MSLPTKSKGVKFAYATDIASVFTATTTGWTLVPKVMSVKWPEGELADIDYSNHDTSGNVREFVSGMEDGGEAEISVLHTHAVYAALKTLKGTQALFRLIGSGGSGIGWTGYIKKLSIEASDLDGLDMIVIKTKQSGDSTDISALS